MLSDMNYALNARISRQLRQREMRENGRNGLNEHWSMNVVSLKSDFTAKMDINNEIERVKEHKMIFL